MLRLQRAPVLTCCLLCLSSLERAVLTDRTLILRWPWLFRSMGGGPRTQPKKRPSRMTLSNKVAEGPNKKRKGALVPTGGLNRKVAYIPKTVGTAGFSRDRSGHGATPALRDRRSAREGRDPSVQGTALALRDRWHGVREEKTLKTKESPDFKQLKMARSLESISLRQKERAKEAIEEVYSFEDFKLIPSIQQGLKEHFNDLRVLSLTAVQRLAIPYLLESYEKGFSTPKSELSQMLIAAETGSGKTLAYVLPILHFLKADEQARENESVSKPMAEGSFDEYLVPDFGPQPRPKAVILVPTAELVSQVGSITKQFCHVVKLKTCLLSVHFSPKVLRSRLNGEPNIIISTPALFFKIMEGQPHLMDRCQYIVVDEADSLFDRSFVEHTTSVIHYSPALKLLLLCSATISRHLDNRLRRDYPNMKRLVTPHLHAIPRRVQLTIVDTDGQPYMSNKLLACADTLYHISKEPMEEGFIKKVIVFVNERETTTEVADYLTEKGIDAVAFSRDTVGREQKTGIMGSILDWFTGPKVEVKATAGVNDSKETNPTFRNKNIRKMTNMRVLVTTDIASRGIDTKTVKNVVLYDVPFSTIDFIHRLGRTGRMGRRGRAFVLVDKTTNKAWVREVKTSMHMGSSLL